MEASFIQKSLEAKSVNDAISFLFSICENSSIIDKSLDLAIKAHENIFRKSGDLYIVHPLIVASYVAFLTQDKVLIASALLHDVIEDSDFDKEYISKNISENVADIVQGLTNLKSINKKHSTKDLHNIHNLFSSHAKYSEKILLIKLCDRLHNMLTIEVMPIEKIKNKSRETMSIYAPIAHRMGISTIKNTLEDLCFQYLFPDAFDSINNYLITNQANFQATLKTLTEDISLKIHQGSFIKDDFKIEHRIKHKYSIHLKKQRKHIHNSEIFDILAIRILVNTKDDCYRVLGIIHQNYHPIMIRFKDYIATPKENGYETIQTTILNEIATCEIQIRTFDMHKTAEFGIASHWKYKELSSKKPELSWMESLSLTDDMHEFDELIQDKLKIDTIDVYSPQQEKYTIQRYATAIDYAYKIHNDIGQYAQYAYINNKKSSLITVLEHNDTINIITDNSKIRINCLWENIVTTKKARDSIRAYCKSYINAIDNKYVFSLLSCIFQKETLHRLQDISKGIDKKSLLKASSDIQALIKVVGYVNESLKKGKSNLSKFIHNRIILKEKKIDNFLIYSNRKIKKIEYDFCCHPKKGDNVVAFLDNKNIFVHNKMCDMALKMIENNKSGIFISWNINQINQLRLIVALKDKVGVLAEFITRLSKDNISITSLELGKDSIHLKSNNVQVIIDTELDIEYVRDNVLKNFNVIEISHIKDNYL